ncbi:MAG TPA: helix-turn-helix transcriptional regulator [Candidatus Merdisoma merdipullorum]|nr:helix-turn-helix transcriptional regulator [Candidatus Merdisoma merdipullorum]
MKKEDCCRIERCLDRIPEGTFQIVRHSCKDNDTGLFTKYLQAESKGRGILNVYPVYPGIEVSVNCFLTDKAVFHHASAASVLEISHCHAGRVGWNMKNDMTVYLGAGDLACHSTICCSDSEMIFPMKYYEGISIFLNLDRLSETSFDILPEAGNCLNTLRAKYGKSCESVFIPSCLETDCIFLPLYDAPEALRLPYFRLKLQELLLYLGRYTPVPGRLTPYRSGQTELIRQIHRRLTEDLNRRYTIEELSREYLINTSSLKEIFKAVYGQPVASYMKEYRIREAMKLLRETDGSISSISSQVGYESQGKFTKAFRDVAHILPSEYRKQCRRNGMPASQQPGSR